MSLLEVRDLRTEFWTRDHRVIRAVDGVSLTLDAGETLGLVGESGSGKSVTALSIMRLVPNPPGRIVGGEVVLDGHDVLLMGEAELRRVRGATVAMVFQDPMSALNPVVPIGNQVTEAVTAHRGLGSRAARTRAVDLLSLVGIPDPDTRFNHYPHQFSGGMRQRVVLAIAIASEPKLLLADEITTALDVTIQAQMLELLKGLARRTGMACLLITHDLGVVAGMTQRLAVMYAGQIVESGRTADVFATPRMPYTRGLLRSTPRLDRAQPTTLIPIDGSPPDMAAPSVGCRFQPRCSERRSICREQEPPLAPVTDAGPDHVARCWGALDVPGGGWLKDQAWQPGA